MPGSSAGTETCEPGSRRLVCKYACSAAALRSHLQGMPREGEKAPREETATLVGKVMSKPVAIAEGAAREGNKPPEVAQWTQ